MISTTRDYGCFCIDGYTDELTIHIQRTGNESIYLDRRALHQADKPDDEDVAMIHADYPAFETDIEFEWLTLDEQHQVLEGVIAELREREQ